MTPIITLDLQFAMACPALSSEQITEWATAAVTEVNAIYTDNALSVPYEQVLLTLRFCDEDEGRALNQQFRQKDNATNVLTFEYGTDPEGTLSGDIIICVPVLEKEALEQHKPFVHHAAHLCVHGVLHALGYDHLDDEEAEEMEGLETDILAHFSIPDPYTSKSL